MAGNTPTRMDDLVSLANAVAMALGLSGFDAIRGLLNDDAELEDFDFSKQTEEFPIRPENCAFHALDRCGKISDARTGEGRSWGDVFYGDDGGACYQGIICGADDKPSALVAIETGELPAYAKHLKNGEIDQFASRVSCTDFSLWVWRTHSLKSDFLPEPATDAKPARGSGMTPQSLRKFNTLAAMFLTLAEHGGFLKSGDFKFAGKAIAKALQAKGANYDPVTIERRLMDGAEAIANTKRKADTKRPSRSSAKA